MSTPADALKYQLLAELLRTLEAAGYSFGVEKHLQLRQLLLLLPEDTPIEELREILAPAICTNEQDQIFFYDIFPACLERAQAVHQALPETKTPEKNNLWLWWISILSTILLVVLALILWEETEDIIGKPKVLDPQFDSVQPDSARSICINAEELAKLAPIVDAWICEDSLIRRGESDYGRFRLETNTCLYYEALDTLGQDSVCITLIDSSGYAANVFFYLRLETIDIPPPDQEPKDTTEALPAYTKRAYPFPVASSIIRNRLEVEPLSGVDAFLVDNAWWLKPILIFLLGALLWSILKYRDQKRQKLVAEVETRDKAPYIWDIEIEGLEAIEMNPAFSRSVHQLRRRTLGDSFLLNIPKTVQKTVKNAGMINFAYSQQTRPPEYLLLIDCQNAANHQALVFDLLYKAFQKSEIFIERFFYDDDPRHCYNESYPDGISIRDLQLRFYNSRLLILGNAYQLLNPMTGKLARWTEIFTQWRERALLTTRPTGKWGRDERRLGERFKVLPASIQGLAFLIEQFDAGDDADFDSWPEHVKDAIREPVQLEGGLIRSLQRHYSEEMMVWIAACAVYPSLHWDLSLHLGTLLSDSEHQLLQIDQLLNLSRLPWFVQGEIPKEARVILVEWLEEQHPETLQQVRTSLHDILQQSSPPEDSAVWEGYSMNVALNEWLIEEDAAKKKALENRIADMLENGVEADFTVIKYLDRERSPLDFIVPDNWKKYVHKGGYSGLGMKESWWDAFRWAIPIWVILSSLIAWYQPETECNGELKVYNEAAEKEWRYDLDGEVENVAFLSNDRTLVVASNPDLSDRSYLRDHNSLDYFNVLNRKGELIQHFARDTFGTTGGASISSFAVDPVDETVLLVRSNGAIEVWGENGALQETAGWPANIIPGELKLIPGRDFFLSAQGNSASVLSFLGKPDGDPFRIPEDTISAFAVSANGEYCAMVGPSNVIKVWSFDRTFRVSTPSNLPEQINDEESFLLTALAFSPDGGFLVAGSDNGRLILFDRQSGNVLRRLPSQVGRVNAITPSLSGKYIVVGGDQGFAFVMDYAGNILHPFILPGQNIMKVGFGENEESIITLSESGQVRSRSLNESPVSEYCIDTDEDRILWREYLAQKAIQQRAHNKVDTFKLEVDRIHQNGSRGIDSRALDTAWTAFHQNLAVSYNNIAVDFANQYNELLLTDTAQLRIARDSACFYFSRAAQLFPEDTLLQNRVANFCEEGEMPSALLAASAQACCAPCSVEFQNLSINAKRYIWDFGDGTKDTLTTTTTPNHTYSSPGNYTVLLQAVNGVNIASVAVIITVRTCEDPNADRDGDGVPDRIDNCPDDPGTIKGCPDSDRDGVLDKDDKCPNTPGTITNYGCPEQGETDAQTRLRDLLVTAIKEQQSTFYKKIGEWENLDNEEVSEYLKSVSEDFERLSNIKERRFLGTEDGEKLVKDYNDQVDQLIREVEQRVKKLDAGRAQQGSSSELRIAAGQTYTISSNQQRKVDRFIMGEGATLKFAEGVTSFELIVGEANIADNTTIDGRGKNGEMYQYANGRSGANGGACRPGKNGQAGSTGRPGENGVNITLKISELNRMGTLSILTNGGDGSRGGNGGRGGRGGNSKGTLFKCECKPQNGGKGGDGGNGGDGGVGGSVTVQYLGNNNSVAQNTSDDFAKRFRSKVNIRTAAGEAGLGGEGGRGGAAGQNSGTICPSGARAGNPGRSGNRGASAVDGAIRVY